MKRVILAGLAVLSLGACTKKDAKPEVWVYTSLYKDTVADIQARIQAAVPEAKIQFFQAGSEEVAAKINAEELAGATKADVMVFSDRFWFEDMAQKGRLHKYSPKGSETVAETLKNKDGWYAAASIPVMVMIYNSEAFSESQAPKSFKEMADPKWKGKFSTGSPLASGTNFTTVAFLQKAYGWEYFKSLRKNDTISEGGNSSVIRRVQTKERPVGWVLLENVLRIKESTSKLKVIYPDDGVVLQSNVLALAKKDTNRAAAQKVADWFFSQEGQQAMVRSYMYASVPGFPPPEGAPPFEVVLAKAQKWTPELVQNLMKSRESIKEEFTKIMFQ